MVVPFCLERKKVETEVRVFNFLTFSEFISFIYYTNSWYISARYRLLLVQSGIT